MQSGDLGDGDAAKGVDGFSTNEYCAHPRNSDGGIAWYSVDLGGIHQIFNVTVYNTDVTDGRVIK